MNKKRDLSVCDEQGPPKKRGRPSRLKCDHVCGPCTLWLSSGSNDNLKQFHECKSGIRHPGSDCNLFSVYAVSNTDFSMEIKEDSCVCNSCFRDFYRFCQIKDKHSFVPRWFKFYQQEHGLSCKHCLLCCSEVPCSCSKIKHWGNDHWFETEGINFWCEYLSHYKGLDPIVFQKNKSLCVNHYKELRKRISNRSCVNCGNSNSESLSWDLVGSLQMSNPVVFDILKSLLDKSAAVV